VILALALPEPACDLRHLRAFTAVFVEPDDLAGSGASSRG
jgi:hypothetical protein